jgi:hypothetical protein
MAAGTQMQTAWALWIRDLAEIMETHLAEVKHKGELKLWHPEPLACGRLLHATIHWKNKEADTPMPLPGLHPTGAQGPCPNTGGLQHCQIPAPNLPRRCRQTGLKAKGATPELVRLKFYCSWTRNFSFLFSLFFKCLFILFAVWLSTTSPCWFLWFSFFFPSFSFSFLSLFLGFVSFTIVS